MTSLEVAICFVERVGGVPGPGLVEALYEDPRPLTPPRDCVHQVRLHALPGSHVFTPWIDRVLRTPGWCEENVRTMRSLLAPGGQTVSRLARFCKNCGVCLGLLVRECRKCECGSERGAGQFDAGRDVVPYPPSHRHRVFRFPLRHANPEEQAWRYVDVLLAECSGTTVYLEITGEGEMADLQAAMESLRDAARVEILVPASTLRPLFARDLPSEAETETLGRKLDAWASVRVTGVRVIEDAVRPLCTGEPEEYLFVLDDMVVVGGFDWRLADVAQAHVEQSLECVGMAPPVGWVRVQSTDVETAYVTLGGSSRRLQPFFERGNTLRVSLGGDAEWRRQVVSLIRTHGLRSERRGVGTPVSVYPVSECARVVARNADPALPSTA